MADYRRALSDAQANNKSTCELFSNYMTEVYPKLNQFAQNVKADKIAGAYMKTVVDLFMDSLPNGDVEFFHHSAQSAPTVVHGVASVQKKPLTVDVIANTLCPEMKYNFAENQYVTQLEVALEDGKGVQTRIVRGTAHQAHEFIHAFNEYIENASEAMIFDITKGRIRNGIAKEHHHHNNNYSFNVHPNYSKTVLRYFGITLP